MILLFQEIISDIPAGRSPALQRPGNVFPQGPWRRPCVVINRFGFFCSMTGGVSPWTRRIPG